MPSVGIATLSWLAVAMIPMPNSSLVLDARQLLEKFPVEQIIIVGDTETPSYLIRYILGFGPGDKVSTAELRATQSRLSGLGLWTNPTVFFLEPIQNTGRKDVLVSIEERPWNWFLSVCYEAALFRITDKFEHLNCAGLRSRDKILEWIDKQ